MSTPVQKLVFKCDFDKKKKKKEKKKASSLFFFGDVVAYSTIESTRKNK